MYAVILLAALLGILVGLIIVSMLDKVDTRIRQIKQEEAEREANRRKFNEKHGE